MKRPADPGAVRAAARVVVDVLERLGPDLLRAGPAISEAQRAERSLGSRARRLVGDALWEAVRLDGRARARLTAAGASPDDPRARAALALAWTLQAAQPDAAVDLALLADVCGAAPGPLGVALALPAPDPATAELPALAAEWSVPAWLAEDWVQSLGRPGAAARAAAMNGRAPLGLRVNTRLATRDAVAAALAALNVASRPGLLSPDALLLEGHPNVRALAPWRDGLFEVQDEASQLAVRWLVPDADAARGGVVVDLCAGAGGKTLALANLAPHAARLIAVERDGERLSELRTRARRAAVGALECVRADATATDFVARAGGQATHVFVDAPCSGLGTLRRDPTLRWRATRGWADGFPPVQRAILDAGLRLLARGGRLVYATCTTRRAENDAVVDAVLASHRDVRRAAAPADAALAALADPGGALRLAPETHGTDGFFAVALERA